MKTLEMHDKLKSIPSKDLAKLLNIGTDMAKKYRLFPNKHTPDAIQAEKIKIKFKIPTRFWGDIKSYLQENDTKQSRKIATTKGV